MLSKRKQHILFSIVEQYILSAEPVGSNRLVEKYNLDYSPATVRNELAELENLGFLSHPYTSAGRIPTDSGYRFYVDSLINQITLPAHEEQMVGKFFAELNTELEDLMHQTSNLLSKLTNHFSLVFAPPIRRNRLKHIDLIHLKKRRLLIIPKAE